MFGLPIERSMSSMSGVGGSGPYGMENSYSSHEQMLSGMDTDQPFAIQRFPSVEQIFRLPSFECIRRMSSIDDIRRLASIETMQDVPSDIEASLKRFAPRLDDFDMQLNNVSEEGESESDHEDAFDSTTVDQSLDSAMAATPDLGPKHSRRRVRSPSGGEADSMFEQLDESRPWEHESTESLNVFPVGFETSEKDLNLSFGDLRVLARFHVQKRANAKGIKLAAGMTNSELVALADTLGLYPLVFRLHLEACGKIPLPELHDLYLHYKRESKERAKKNKAQRDVNLASVTRIGDDGKITMDYYDGIALRLGRERDTIFRPLLHKVFKEFKPHIRDRLAEAGLAHNEMRKWRDTQLCTALWVANQFVPGIWQAAVDVHLSKTKDFM